MLDFHLLAVRFGAAFSLVNVTSISPHCSTLENMRRALQWRAIYIPDRHATVLEPRKSPLLILILFSPPTRRHTPPTPFPTNQHVSYLFLPPTANPTESRLDLDPHHPWPPYHPSPFQPNTGPKSTSKPTTANHGFRCERSGDGERRGGLRGLVRWCCVGSLLGIDAGIGRDF
jgi:hypothetical protein